MTWAPALLSALERGQCDAATDVLRQAVESKLVAGATVCVRQKNLDYARAFGSARSVEDRFLLGSITKPICMTALLTLLDQGRFQLDDRASQYLSEFTGEGREQVTIRQLLTHTCGLPDQLPENNALRARHAPLPEFIAAAQRTSLLFSPGTKYSYSSMGTLLAAAIAQRLSGKPIAELTEETVFRPLGMQNSALGLGRWQLEEMQPCQTEYAAPESGAGDPSAKEWDWNSRFWRSLGAPWGGAHCSAPDVARWLDELLYARGKSLRPETARLMRQNHNRPGLTPRGLGLALGTLLGGKQVSEETFGHTGSTGTIAWADPRTETICVVLTTLPGRAVDPHPRQQVSDRVAASAK